MSKRKVMLIDDDEAIHRVLGGILEHAGYDYRGVHDGWSAIEAVRKEHPDLILMDVMLPGRNGYDLCREIRDQGRRVPIIMLTAKGDIVDKSMGFRGGCDDYVTKPFDAEELLLRIDANIRRHEDALEFAHCLSRDGVARIGALEVRFDEYQVLVKGKPVDLTTKEFEILAFLAANPGKVFTRSQIQEYIWGEGDSRGSNNITVFVRKIREKIEENPSEPKYLLTVQRVGYKMASSLNAN